MADEAGTTHADDAGGGPTSDGGPPSPGVESVAPSPDGSGPLAPPIGGTPTPPAPSEPEVDWEQRYGDLKTKFDENNVSGKATQAENEAYKQTYGALQPETATAPPANPWLAPAPAQQPQAVPYGQALTPPAQGVKNAMDEAILSGDSIAYEAARQWGQRLGMIPADAPAVQDVPQGMSQEQVQAIMQQGFHQQAAVSQAVVSAVDGARKQFGPEFMNGEITVQGVPMTREAALRDKTGQTGDAAFFNTMLNLDGAGVMAAIYQQSEAKVRYDQEQAANAGQITSGATVPRPQQPPSSALNAETARLGAIFSPPKDPNKA